MLVRVDFDTSIIYWDSPDQHVHYWTRAKVENAIHRKT